MTDADPRPEGAWTPQQRRSVRRAVLIPLLTILAMLVLVLFFAIPDFGHNPRARSNEAAAASTLKSLLTEQARFQLDGRADTDGDGVGEYGFFRELSGAVPVRTDAEGATAGGTVLEPPALPTAFRSLEADGVVARSGYRFRIFLAGPDGRAVAESPTGDRVATGTLDADLCETTWCAYAWPATPSNITLRTFFVNQEGEILQNTAGHYRGSRGPPPGAAFTSGGVDVITGPLARAVAGQDGGVWKPVQ